MKDMTAPAFTPGPWQYAAGVVTTDCETIAQSISPRTVGGYAPLPERQAVADANGALIAAAPELYEALREIVENVEAYSHPGVVALEMAEIARAALARADGGGK